MRRPTRSPTWEELREAYAGKRVFLTGHTGFKGGWLALWLSDLGAEITGYALPPVTKPSLFEAADVASLCRHVVADLRDRSKLKAAFEESHPDFVFHLAAQALVRRSYEEPIETIETNVIGTANLLETIRRARRPCSVVIVTSDKCYENREWHYAYREDDAMGGHDLYSTSKGACELVVAGYRRSFFHPTRLQEHGVALATARAGNVIGGGDWSADRIVPDCMAALAARRAISVRNPDAVRPWQHVIEPLSGYLLLGARLSALGTAHPEEFCEPWNLGPSGEDSQSVSALVEEIIAAWGGGTWEQSRERGAPHEALQLRLGIEKAQARLRWTPRWRMSEAVRRAVEWYKAHGAGAQPDSLRALCMEQIKAYIRGNT